MKVLVTGANGYIGVGIVNKLLDLGCEVIATDLKLNNLKSSCKKIECDLFSIKNPFEYFDKPDCVLHLAWRDGFFHYSDAHIIDLPKHYMFLKRLSEKGINKISVLGSMHEVGFYEGCICNDTVCKPTTPYGISKYSLRLLTQELCKKNKNNFLWLRGYYIVGNSILGNSIFSKITKAVQDGKSEFPFTTGINQYDFLDYDDFCDILGKSIIQNEIEGIVEVCSGYPQSLADRVERFIKENGFPITLKYGVFPDRPYDSKALWGDNAKSKLILDHFDENNY